MNTAGANELGYASEAILTALMEELIASNVLSVGTASTVLDKAAANIQGSGNFVWVKGALGVVTDIRRQLGVG